MASNYDTGRTRTIRYCGVNYVVRPCAKLQPGYKKRAWEVTADDVVIAGMVWTKSRCLNRIHAHAVAQGRYPTMLADGLTYEDILGRLRK